MSRCLKSSDVKRRLTIVLTALGTKIIHELLHVHARMMPRDNFRIGFILPGEFSLVFCKFGELKEAYIQGFVKGKVFCFRYPHFYF